jgi:hypothetical protein
MTHGHARTFEPKLYGLVAEFTDSNQIVEAAKKAYEAGYRKMDAYTPFPVHGLVDALGTRDDRVPWVVFFSGALGALGGYFLQYYISAGYYPLNAGGKPLFSWPASIPITFEVMVLSAAFGAFLGMLLLNGLPKPYHPIFNASRFALSSQDRFYLCIEVADPQFNIARTHEFLQSLGAYRIEEVMD